MKVSVGHHFSAGHRILGLVGPGAKCANVHGHTFTVCATFDQTGELAVEFTTAKTIMRQWIDKQLDHGFIVHQDDTECLDALKLLGSKHYVTAERPTTEVIATEIAEALLSFFPGTRLLSVHVGEGPHNSATWEPT